MILWKCDQQKPVSTIYQWTRQVPMTCLQRRPTHCYTYGLHVSIALCAAVLGAEILPSRTGFVCILLIGFTRNILEEAAQSHV